MLENDIITLEDNSSYLILDTVTLDDIQYYYLCSTTKPLELKIAVEREGQLYFVLDKDILVEVYDVFVNRMRDKLGIKEG